MCLYIDVFAYYIKCQAIEKVEAEEDKTLERELKSLFGNSEVLQLRKELGDVFFSKSSGVFWMLMKLGGVVYMLD